MENDRSLKVYIDYHTDLLYQKRSDFITRI